MDFTFENVTTKKVYQAAKTAGNFHFESVPNTAAGFERCRCYAVLNGHKYFLSCNTEKDYFLMFDNDINHFSIFFSISENKITIKQANENNRTFSAAKYLKKYSQLLTVIHSCIKYDKIIEYIPYK